MLDTILRKLAHHIVVELLDHLDDIAAAIAKAVVDKATDAIPGQLDDRLLDGLAGKIAGALVRLPFGGILGGR